jgi:hypothetical protein
MSKDDVEYEITSAAMPLFRATALDAMKDAVEKTITPEEAWNIMDTRRKDLLIPEEKSDELVSTVVINALGAPLEEVKKFVDVANEGAAYEAMMDALVAKETVEKVLKSAGWEDDFYDTFCNPVRRQSVNGMFSPVERNKVYDIMVRRAIKSSEEGKLTDELEEKMKIVKGIMAIDDVTAESQATKSFGPKLFNVMERAMKEIMDDFTPALLETLTAEVEQVIDDYKISDRMIAQNGRSLYGQALAILKSKVRQINSCCCYCVSKFSP